MNCPRCDQQINPLHILTYMNGEERICQECWQKLNECKAKQDYRQALVNYESMKELHDWDYPLNEDQLETVRQYDTACKSLAHWGFNFLRSRQCKMSGAIYQGSRKMLSDYITGKTDFTERTANLILNLF